MTELALAVVRMGKGSGVRDLAPSVQVQAGVLESCAIGEDAFVTGTIDLDRLRREVEHLSEFGFLPSNGIFRGLPLRDVHNRPDDFFVTRLVANAVREVVKVLCGSVRHQRSVLVVESILAVRRAFESALYEVHVVGMAAPQDQIGGRSPKGRTRKCEMFPPIMLVA